MLGVYPSALHVRWTHPRFRIAAVAVDQEPWPFWDGRDEGERVDRWCEAVDWREEWGRASPVGRMNGSSGRVVDERVLAPLGLDFNSVWLTDVLPFFHVHRGPGTQGAAMAERYDVFAREHGLPEHLLPDRPSPARLVEQALRTESQRLVDELIESRSPLLVTLGDEALAVAAALLTGGLPRRLTRTGYGSRHRVDLGGRTLDVLPLVHPGQRSQLWARTHDDWIASL
ncbi:hypothetical protein SAMN06273567_102375 [Geodermatophilus aquaeductus]|uniref:Uracil DNA glycosylase superfamily protein n=1 Tax=Geodermatophilus aquaeductus TaxID=1564161 RepID=A0A521CI65_9ACTN|nr:hypothetical protein SAMN06273567_102375 [Geodermatophilus aquaeductus]